MADLTPAQLAAIEKMEADFNKEPETVRKDGGFIETMFGSGIKAEDKSPILDTLSNGLGAVSQMFSPVSQMMTGAKVVTGALDTYQNSAKRTGNVPVALTAVNTVADVGSFGTLNSAMATLQTQAKVANGAISRDDYNAERAEALDRENFELQEIQAANPLTAMGAGIATGVATGYGVSNLLMNGLSKVAPGLVRGATRVWYGRAGLAATAAGSEAAAYRMGKGGTLEEVARDAGIAALGASAFSSVLDGAGTLYRSAFKVAKSDDIAEATGEEILRFVNNANKGSGEAPMTAVQVQRIVENMGEDATLMDAFPQLKVLAKEVITSDKSYEGSADKIHAVVRARNEFFEDFLPSEGSKTGILSDMLGEGAVRSPTKFDADIDKRFKDLQPRFTKIYADNADVSYSVKDINTDLDKIFGDKTRWTAAQLETVQGIKDNIDYFVKQTQKKTAKALVKQKALTLEQMVDIKNQLQKMAANGQLRVAGSDRVLPLENKELYTLNNVTSYFVEKLNTTVPDMVQPNLIYGTTARAKTAYRAGQAIMAGADDVDKSAFDKFLANPSRSGAERRAFVEGAKQNLFTQIRNVRKDDRSMAAVSKFLLADKNVRKLKALLGDREVNEMVSAMMPHIEKTLVADDLAKLTLNPRANKPTQLPTGLGTVIDAMIAAGAPSGATSKAGAAGAVKRLFSGSGVADEIAGRQAILGNVLPQPAEQVGPTMGALQQLLSRTVRPSDASLINKATAGTTGLMKGGVNPMAARTGNEQ